MSSVTWSLPEEKIINVKTWQLCEPGRFMKRPDFIFAHLKTPNMKKISVLVVLFVTLMMSCKDDPECPYQDSTKVAPPSEVLAVEQYLTTAGITGAVKHPSGLYYKIIAPGTGNTPGQCNQIGIMYKGMLTNGNIFDQTTGQMAVFTLGQLIEGWKIGIPLIKTSGKITLYIPPSLGYGSTGNSSIPANSILIFDVELLAIG
jgi:FKBP-type peptidyl-prolyl cis-trans isomerase FkpA